MRRLIVVLLVFMCGCESEAPEPAPDAGGIVARGAEWSHGRIEPIADGGGL